jgi:hypothetical protein
LRGGKHKTTAAKLSILVRKWIEMEIRREEGRIFCSAKKMGVVEIGSKMSE